MNYLINQNLTILSMICIYRVRLIISYLSNTIISNALIRLLHGLLAPNNQSAKHGIIHVILIIAAISIANTNGNLFIIYLLLFHYHMNQ